MIFEMILKQDGEKFQNHTRPNPFGLPVFKFQILANGFPELCACAGGEVRRDVARVEVRDGHEEARAGEGP